MRKNIMLHGATNWESSNYGDYIYGEMIYNYIQSKSNEFNVKFFQPSDFFIQNLKKENNNLDFKLNETNGVIYVPGGYFGEGHNARLRDNIIQFIRFMPLGVYASFKKIPMSVFGIGAGPNTDILMNFGIKRIINNSDCVTVRDHESYESLKELSNTANIIECFDMILTNDFKTDIHSKKIIQLIDKLGYKKILLVHYNHSKEALEKFAVAVNKFLETNDDYHVVVVSDSLLNFEEEYYQAFKKKINGESTLFKYSNPDELTKLIDISSLILTCKLHLGVVGCILNKSVIAVACHPEKTLRFYRDIKQSERAISLFDVDSNQIFDLLDKYKDESVQIPKECLEKSKISWKMLDNFLVELNEKK